MMKLLNQEQHPHIIHYIEHFEVGTKFIIIMEYLGQDWVDLYDYIELFGPVNEQNSLAIFKSVVETVRFLHALGYCHNDIKGKLVFFQLFKQKKTLFVLIKK
jgi:serine/threonine protein kinase